MSVLRASFVLFLASSITGCGSSPPRTATADTPPADDLSASDLSASDIAGARPFEGPFASFEEVCGAAAGAPDEEGRQLHERCTVRVFELDGAGPFEAMATYFEGRQFDGGGSLGLKTARGWFVQVIPDGRPLGGGLSHHSPASAEFDPATTRFEDGVLRVVQRGSFASFVPGRGNLGSTHREWTRKQQCGLREGVVVCSALEEVWMRDCRVSDGSGAPSGGVLGPFEQGERSCRERGTDIR